MAIYTLAQLRRIEQQAHDEGLELMARAGQASAQAVAARLPVGAPLLVLAGPGNNGGDALVAATWLRQHGVNLQLLLPTEPAHLPADAALAYGHWRASGGREIRALPQTPPALVVDGLFGIGLSRPLGPAWQTLVDAVNAWQRPVLALDVPSGLSAASGQPLGRPVQARWTLSFIGTPVALAGEVPCMGERLLADLALSPDWLAQALAA